jgi:acyl-coenzyme A synthetase/AMP-(fatty) acid ligase
MAGYWADPVLTSGVMRDDVVPGETLYKTGDLVYRDQSDNYVYVGRADRVIKRSGVRISLLELSEAMGKLDAVTSSACLVFDREGELGIVAFVTTNAEISEAELRHAARKLIPDNMVPDRIERVSAMPLNSSNQLDEKKLLSITGLRPLR